MKSKINREFQKDDESLITQLFMSKPGHVSISSQIETLNSAIWHLDVNLAISIVEVVRSVLRSLGKCTCAN